MHTKPAILLVMLFAFCVLFMVTIQACKEAQKHGVASPVVDKKAGDTSYNIAKDIINTAKPFANYYTFNAELDTEKNMRAGWVDTFTINNRQFRFFSDSSQALKIDVYKDGVWYPNVDGNNFTTWDFGLDDINGDGYKDLVISHKYGSDINFYNPKPNMFDTVSWQMLPKDGTLDEKKLLYYNSYGDNLVPMLSELYTFKNARPYYYYTLQLVHGSYDPTKKTISFVGLWKCKNGDGDLDKATLVKKIKYDEDIEQDGFDYATFWAKNYRSLIKQYNK